MISKQELGLVEATPEDSWSSFLSPFFRFDLRLAIFSNLALSTGDFALEYSACDSAWLIVDKSGARVESDCTLGQHLQDMYMNW